MPQIVILGSGFAGLTAIRTLRKLGCRDPITLISPRPVLFYYPSLIWVPAGLRSESDLTVPLDKFFKRYQVAYRQGSVTSLDPLSRTVHTDDGAAVAFDYLLIATGGRFIKKLPGIEHTFIPCEGYASMQGYSQRLAALDSGTLAFGFSSNPFEPAAVRGGPVFEFLFGIDTLLRQQKRRHHFELVFFNPVKEPGKRLGEKAVKALLAEMAKLNIRTHLGHKLTGFSATTVHTEGGDIASDLTLFMPGVTGPAWATSSNLPLSEGGFIKADAHCRVPDFKGIYIAGDCGSYPGPDWLPKQGHIADLQAEVAAINLLKEQQQQPIAQTFKAELICIVDTCNGGIMVYRNPKRAFLTPKSIFFHWAKRFFEWYYLRKYR